MFFIYRVEHLSVKAQDPVVFAGPYGVSPVLNSNEWAEENSTRIRPTPTNDPLLIYAIADLNGTPWTNYFCGFDSLEKLNNWFSRYELENLFKLNFAIVRYEAEVVLQGESQDLFYPSSEREILKSQAE